MTHHHLALALPLLLAGTLLGSSDLVPGVNRFAVASYRQLSQNNGNLILSPLSLSAALSMLLAGARGHTAAGIAAALQQTHPGPGYQASVAALSAELTKEANTAGNQLSIANGIWLQQGTGLQSDFEHTIRTLYQAPLTLLDFHAQTEQARAQINAWTADHTNNKIPELFAPNSIATDTRLVLTSAIYFYGKWDSPFDPTATRNEPFQLDAGQTATAKFMHQKSDFPYAETPLAQILELKYKETPLAFDILLPKANTTLAELEQSLKPELLTSWSASLASRKVQTAIPKFRAESSFALRDMLSQLGMADAFGTTADFSGIDGGHDLAVGNVVHKAFVDVAEEGTEAAAATGITVRPLAIRREQDTVVFRADHPFIFFIRDTSTGAILFEGRLSKP